MRTFTAPPRLIGSTALVLLAVALAPPATALAAPEPEPELAFSPPSHDFGVQRVDSGAADTTFHLTNVGTVTAQLNSLDIVAPGYNPFSIDGGGTDCFGRSLNPGESCSVRVYFGPREPVPYSGQLRASVNGGVTFTAALSGAGGRAVLTAVPNPVDFGPATVASAGTVRTITMTNSGNVAASFFVGVVSGGDVGSFHLLDTSCVGLPLQGGGSCVSHVRFSPLGPGPKTASLAFFGDTDGGAQVLLSGEGIAPAVTLAPTAYDFGAVAVGGASTARWFAVRNGGSSPVDLGAATIVGPDLDQFSLSGDTCTGTTLGAGQECWIRARFTPDSGGEKVATLRLAGGGGTFTAWLTGCAKATSSRKAARHRLRHRLRHNATIRESRRR